MLCVGKSQHFLAESALDFRRKRVSGAEVAVALYRGSDGGRPAPVAEDGGARRRGREAAVGEMEEREWEVGG